MRRDGSGREDVMSGKTSYCQCVVDKDTDRFRGFVFGTDARHAVMKAQKYGLKTYKKPFRVHDIGVSAKWM